MSRVVLEGARYVVTVDEHDTVLEHATITVEDGVITSIDEAGAQSGPSPRPRTSGARPAPPTRRTTPGDVS